MSYFTIPQTHIHKLVNCNDWAEHLLFDFPHIHLHEYINRLIKLQVPFVEVIKWVSFFSYISLNMLSWILLRCKQQTLHQIIVKKIRFDLVWHLQAEQLLVFTLCVCVLYPVAFVKNMNNIKNDQGYWIAHIHTNLSDAIWLCVGIYECI